MPQHPTRVSSAPAVPSASSSKQSWWERAEARICSGYLQTISEMRLHSCLKAQRWLAGGVGLALSRRIFYGSWHLAISHRHMGLEQARGAA